jgi:hypothetical protein
MCVYIIFKVGPDVYIVLNSQLYKDGSGALVEAEQQDRWLDESLEDVKGNARHIVVHI